MSANTLDCGTRPKTLVLLALWRASKPAVYFAIHGSTPPPEPTAAQLEAAAAHYVDYLQGRVIKANFAKYPHLDPAPYDRANGAGAMERAVRGVVEVTFTPT